jgi:hypothetical protein
MNNLPKKTTTHKQQLAQDFFLKMAKSINIENNIKVKTKRPTKFQNK